MCLSPIRLADGTVVACRYCSMCKDNRINDLIGRCIAEQCTALETLAVTLTYKGDGPESAVLRYRDIQLMLKRLRKDGFAVRYICAGEYGTKKGRAHWHIILFFYNRSPEVMTDARIDWKYWPHGLSYFQNPDYKGFKYVMKYALKQSGNDGASKALTMSKKPPLGYRFFMNLADDLVERRLPIHSPEYSFNHVRNSKDQPRKYWLQGRMREMFLDRYYIMWRMQYKTDPPWSDFFVEQYLDKIEAYYAELDPARMERDKVLRDIRDAEKQKAAALAEIYDTRRGIGVLILSSGKTDVIEAFSDGTAVIWYREKQWQVTEENGNVAEQLLLIGLPSKLQQPVSIWLESKWQSHRAEQRRSRNLRPNPPPDAATASAHAFLRRAGRGL